MDARPDTQPGAAPERPGFITYAVLKLLTGRAREVKPVVSVIAAVFLFKLIETGGGH